MLYNEKWDRPKVLSLENLIAWLETQPPEQPYEITRPRTCLMGQFAHAMGDSHPQQTSLQLTSNSMFARIAFGAPIISPTDDLTFGAALERARGFLTSR